MLIRSRERSADIVGKDQHNGGARPAESPCGRSIAPSGPGGLEQIEPAGQLEDLTAEQAAVLYQIIEQMLTGGIHIADTFRHGSSRCTEICLNDPP
jgi:hypothetical protein